MCVPQGVTHKKMESCLKSLRDRLTEKQADSYHRVEKYTSQTHGTDRSGLELMHDMRTIETNLLKCCPVVESMEAAGKEGGVAANPDDMLSRVKSALEVATLPQSMLIKVRVSECWGLMAWGGVAGGKRDGVGVLAQ